MTIAAIPASILPTQPICLIQNEEGGEKLCPLANLDEMAAHTMSHITPPIIMSIGRDAGLFIGLKPIVNPGATTDANGSCKPPISSPVNGSDSWVENLAVHPDVSRADVIENRP